MSRSATSIRSRSAGGASAPSTRTYSKKSYATWMSRAGIRWESRGRDAVLRFRDDVVDDCFQVIGLLEHLELPISSSATLDDLQGVLDICARAEIIDDVIHEFEQFVEQHVERHF